jgi:hypothetical protein
MRCVRKQLTPGFLQKMAVAGFHPDFAGISTGFRAIFM